METHHVGVFCSAPGSPDALQMVMKDDLCWWQRRIILVAEWMLCGVDSVTVAPFVSGCVNSHSWKEHGNSYHVVFGLCCLFASWLDLNKDGHPHCENIVWDVHAPPVSYSSSVSTRLGEKHRRGETEKHSKEQKEGKQNWQCCETGRRRWCREMVRGRSWDVGVHGEIQECMCGHWLVAPGLPLKCIFNVASSWWIPLWNIIASPVTFSAHISQHIKIFFLYKEKIKKE